MYISRHAEKTVNHMLSTFKVLLITGPRQVGKTTMLHHLLGVDYNYVTLDDMTERSVAKQDPRLFFINNPGNLIIDEIQYAPELFSELKRIVDSKDEYGQFVLTGSQTFSLMEHVSESLAGRVGIIELGGLTLREIQQEPPLRIKAPGILPHPSKDEIVDPARLWEIIQRGSMPELYKLEQLKSEQYYASYVNTFLERDVRQIVNVADLTMFATFLSSLAARTGQLLNYHAIANEIGIDAKTAKRWISILETSGQIQIVPPFSNNSLTRVIKTPVLYFMDTGLVSHLLKWTSPQTLMMGAMAGPILETFVFSELAKSYKNQGLLRLPIYHYRDKDSREIDLIIENSGVLTPIEVKKTASPTLRMTRHFSILERAVGYDVGQKYVVCFVEKTMHLAEDVIAYPIGGL